MSRPFIPTAVAEVKGTFLAHPERKRPAEPKDARPLGAAPKRLSPEHLEVWNELAEDALPGVLRRSDRTAFEQLVRLVLMMRTETLVMAADRTSMIALLGRFAMTPADRCKVAVEEAPSNSLSNFLNRQKPAQETNEVRQQDIHMSSSTC
jgi:hypothetical protein